MLGVEPFECLMIGDDSVRDIEPARKLGMQCLLVEAGSEERVFSCLAFDD
jgi:FMN phosphatase YigB (HAD superfamily)